MIFYESFRILGLLGNKCAFEKNKLVCSFNVHYYLTLRRCKLPKNTTRIEMRQGEVSISIVHHVNIEDWFHDSENTTKESSLLWCKR